jgi:hypothetical protein
MRSSIGSSRRSASGTGVGEARDDVARIVDADLDRGALVTEWRGDLDGAGVKLAPLELMVGRDRVRDPGQLGEVAVGLPGIHLGTGLSLEREAERAHPEGSATGRVPVEHAE